MRNILRIFLLIAGIVLILGSQTRAEVAVGESAPNFSLKDTKGQAHSLFAYEGKFVVLEWINHDCPFVRKHYESRNMQTLQQEYTDKGVIWLSVSSSSPGKQGYLSAEEADRLTEQKEAAATAVLLDPEGTVGRLYGAQTTPHMFIVDPKGNVIYQGAIDSIPSTDISDLSKADNYVRMALDAAMNGDPVKIAATISYGCSVKY